MQFGYNFFKVNLALADRRFVAEFMTILGVDAVFDMQIADILAENVQRVDRIAFTVKNDICGIEVDTQVWQSDIFDSAEQCYRSFLSGFEPEF